jgi:hypothetical protein
MDGEIGGSFNFDSLEIKNASDKRLALLLLNGGDGGESDSLPRRSTMRKMV